MAVEDESQVSAAEMQDSLGELGLAMLGAGYAVTDIQSALERSAKSANFDMVIGTLPSGILIDCPQLARTRMYSQPSTTSLRWDQAADVGIAADAAGVGRPVSMWSGLLQKTLASKARYGSVLACLGSGMSSAAISVIFGISVAGMIAATIFGVLVGAMMIWAGRWARLSSVLPLLCAFVVSAILFSIGDQVGLGHSPLFAICAPLVMLIPGATITNGVVELAAGDMVSGSARIASGLMIWAMLVLGIAGGAAVSRADFTTLGDVPASGFPAWAPWIALLVMAFGLHLFFSTGLVLTISTAVSLEVAYGLQTLIKPATGALVAAGLTAAVALLASRIIERFQPRLPSIVTFRPAFWILVPGTMGVVTLTEMATNQDTTGGVVWTVAATAISIGIGVQVGAFLSEFIRPPASR